jgi:3-oxoacyl-[acyl-carrier protein] reductase
VLVDEYEVLLRGDVPVHGHGRDALGVPGITVNAVAPGATRTATNGSFFEAPGLAELIAGTTALDRLGKPDDVADIVAFLASDAARWITGQVIDASGGLFLGPRA